LTTEPSSTRPRAFPALLVGILTVHVRGGSVGVGRPAVSICSGAVLGGVTDTGLRRVVVDMGSLVVNTGRFIVPVSGSAVGVGGALTGFFDVLRRESGIVL